MPSPTPQSTPHLAVVMPCYKAEATIATVIEGIPQFVPTIVVVDDRSPDASAERVEELADPRVHLIRHEENQGVGGATMSGYARAAELGAEIIVKMDSDNQMDPAKIPALVAPILAGEADHTKGNRFLHARELKDMPLLRRIGNLGLSFSTKLASGYWNVFDPTNGYTAIHASIVPLFEPGSLKRGFFFETSVLLELSLMRAVVRDVDMPARYGSEVSNLSEMEALFSFPLRQLRGFLRRIWVQYFLRDFGLFSLFLVSGLGLAGFGALFGAYHWYQSWRIGEPAPLGTIMLAALPLLIGVQFILQALLLDVQSRPVLPLQRQLREREELRGLLYPVPAASDAVVSETARAGASEVDRPVESSR